MKFLNKIVPTTTTTTTTITNTSAILDSTSNNTNQLRRNVPINILLKDEKDHMKKYLILDRYLDTKSKYVQFNSFEKENDDNNNNQYIKEQPIDIESLNNNKSNGLIDKFGVYRDVYCMDALEWLNNNTIESNTSVITSLPDITEVSGFTVEQYKQWFSNTVQLIGSKLGEKNVGIVYQTDIKRHWKNDRSIIEEYIDKSYLSMKGIEASGCKVIWHKIMAANDLTKKIITKNKSSFTHMIAFAKSPQNIKYQDNTPDINTRGNMIWSRAMGLNACEISTSYVRGIGSTTVLDPFCGKGSVLAVANVYGLNSIGIDLSTSKFRNSLNLQLNSETVKEFTTNVWKNSDNYKTKDKEDKEDKEHEDKDNTVSVIKN